MNSEERRAARRKRREEKRAQKRAERLKDCTLENVAKTDNLFDAAREAAAGVNWKSSTQRYMQDQLRNAAKARRDLLAGVDASRGFIHFSIYERGKRRDISAVHFSERPIQKSLTKNALIPAIEPTLIDANSANRKGYSGTTVFARRKPLSVVNGIDGQYNDEGRVITLEYPDFYLITSYTPNAQPELKRLDYRMAFEDALRGYMVRLNETIKNPKANVGKPGFSDEERAKMTELLAAGFTDSFRYLYPDLKDQYTWWSYRMKARERNTGWRIDYFIVSDSMRGRIKDSLIYKDVMGSDHCPIGLEIAE